MPALRSIFSLIHVLLPHYLSGRKSSSEPRRIVKQHKVETEDWVLVCGAPQWPHYARWCQMDGKRLMVHTAHFYHWCWHPDITWFRDAELQYTTGMTAVFPSAAFSSRPSIWISNSIYVTSVFAFQFSGLKKYFSSTTPLFEVTSFDSCGKSPGFVIILGFNSDFP